MDILDMMLLLFIEKKGMVLKFLNWVLKKQKKWILKKLF